MTASITEEAPLLTVNDYERRAREMRQDSQFAVLFGSHGADGWTTNTNNLDGLAALQLCPRVMVDVSKCDLSTTVLGQPIAMPIMTGPAGLHQRFHRDGESATARGTGAAGTLMTLSTAASYSIEEVGEVATGPLWFQTFFFKDRGLTELLVHRAQKAGYRAIVITVDNPGARPVERDRRHGYRALATNPSSTLEPERVLRNFRGIDRPNLPTPDAFTERFDTAVDWSNVDWIRSITSLPIVIKGVQTAEDARLCVRHGVDALVVSNHGGLAAADARSTVEALPEVVDAVGSELEVYIDGGIRRGTDVLKCLALGARAVFVGRAYLWGLSVEGEEGVRNVMEILTNELRTAMFYCGVTNAQNVSRTLLSNERLSARSDVVDRLQRLVSMLDGGYLSRDEFDNLKTRLILD
jgi:isopentenyl diphosphate isomerase/L-lactate dehydrogenase-like FMN-dependent dehydrogenase